MRSLVLLLVLASMGCALRPRYRDFVTPKTEAKQVTLLVTNGAGQPLADVKVEMSEWKNRLSFTSGADGTFVMPVDKKYLDENPVLVVQVPQGQPQYTVALAPPPLPVEPPPPAIEPPALVPPVPVSSDQSAPPAAPAAPAQGTTP